VKWTLFVSSARRRQGQLGHLAWLTPNLPPSRDQARHSADDFSMPLSPHPDESRETSEMMRKLTPAQEAVLRRVEENPGCKPEGREAEQLRRFGLVELDTPTTTSLIGYRITEAGRDYLDAH
jgi:hypothetical protein